MKAPASNISLERVHGEQSARTIATEENCSQLGLHLGLVLGLVLILEDNCPWTCEW